jgi:hypothetical protein
MQPLCDIARERVPVHVWIMFGHLVPPELTCGHPAVQTDKVRNETPRLLVAVVLCIFLLTSAGR